ncbi:MAG: HYR domain-containing protein, partial [Saprospiraceae bacterium]|nr:HYR domain-containing protein [Saprospiraceae bacterium]
GCTVFVNWSEPTVVDNCGIQSIVSDYPNGYDFPEGTTTITYTATDNCGNSATATFTITVNCQIGCPTPPGISCPYTFLACPDPVNPDPSLSGWATAWPGEPNCNIPVLTYTDQIVSTGPCTDGKIIHRTWKATDPDNPDVNNSCVQTIKLEDHIGPNINNCPSNIVVSGTGYNCTVPVSWNIPDVYDNCGVASLKAYDQHGKLVNSGDSFGQGYHTITYLATDHCGNSTNCSFNITVNCLTCITAPVISCPADAWLCIGESTSPLYHGYATATGGAYCPNPIVTYQDWIVSTGPCAGQKVIKRVWTASYQGIGGLSSSCEQLLYVEDAGVPVFYGCPQNITVAYNDNVVYWNPPHVVDGCGNVTITSNYNPGHTFPYGYTTVVYTATDACGNVSTCSFTIHVTGAPVPLNCPDDIYLDCTTNGGAYANWTPPVYDGCNDCDNGNYIPGFIFMGEYNGHQYYCSLAPAKWNTAKQICANNGGYLASINSAGENNFLTNQLLAQSAWIGLNDKDWEGDFEWENGDPLTYQNWYPGQPNNYNNNQDYVELMASGKWNDQYNHYSLEFIMELPCSSSNVQQIAGPAPGSFLPEGTHTVIYQVSDACGSNATCSFDIIVSGGITMDCPDDIVLTVQSNSTGATVNWTPPTASSCCSACNGNGAPIAGFIYMGSLDGHHYYCSTSPATWQTAQANCLANGGHLAVINNATENNFLASKLTMQSAFIGLSDHVNEGWFEWVNGDPLTYQNWYPNQPNNYGSGQDYVELLHSGQWNDQYNHASLEYIMEISNCLTVNQIAGPAPGSNIPAGTTHTVTYQAEDGCGNIETCSFDITVLGSPPYPTLCPSGGINSAESYIDRFMFADIDNTTGDDGGYADYTNVCTKILENETYPIVLGAGYGNGWPEKAYWKVWIDYNMDGDFLDPYEFVAYGAGVGTLSGFIKTPSHLYQGQTTLRVAMSLNDYPLGPCEVVTYGETEDYCIVIATTKTTAKTEIASRNNESALIPVDLSAVEDERDIKLYPSPASDFINIEFSDSENLAKMEIFSMNGRLIRSLNERVIENMVTINVSDLQDGMYYFLARYKDGSRISEKLIIQH